MQKVLEVVKKTRTPMEELVVELDFFSANNGTAPALRNPPEFKAKDARGYFTGDRPNAPDWFSGSYRASESGTLGNLKAQYERMKPGLLLCLVRTPSFTNSYRVTIDLGNK